MRLPKTYEAGNYEAEIYQKWEQSGAFKPKTTDTDDYFSIVAPPPNANADLHIGYGLVVAIQDIAVRYNRMLGKATLYVPGADHAGFETQSVYEKQLAKEGKSRFDFSRDELYKRIWDFVAKNRGGFEKQFRNLGASFDWDYFTFTLDPKVVKQAYSTFKKMWNEELIYRGERLVNFCTFHGTAFADIEVEYKEEQGYLWFIKYPLSDGSGEVVVATTRPETMLGDVAVAVSPTDKRYKKYIGKTVKLPLTNREIPILADEMVDPEFGTGAVKITPAHDPNDFEVARRHDLPMITVISFEGKMTHEAPQLYRNLDVKEARRKVVEDLKEHGFLQKVEDYTHSVGHCYKCGTVIQPLLKEQWFVDMQPLAQQAIKALEAKKVRFYPDSKRTQLMSYLEGLHDWNISRQIAWGIPIPAFQSLEEPDKWIFDERVDQEEIEIDGKTYRRDPDVFDTWFSSSSWPYVTLNYPKGEAFKKFYPLSLMETGGEILYPWVSRMLMLGLYVTGEVPFTSVYIHGYVMAEDGAKMSKSLGNVIDLTEVIDKYGSDALRMGIIDGRVPAVNSGYDSRKIEEARNFCNKLWNIARYCETITESKDSRTKSIADNYILWRLDSKSDQIKKHLNNYELSEAYADLYDFVWNDLASWYIEVSKISPNPKVLREVLGSTLKIAHPFAPFITEAIWQTLEFKKDGLLINEIWPVKLDFEKEKGRDFREGVAKLTREVRHYQSILGERKQNLLFEDPKIIEENKDIIMHLARLGNITKVNKGHGIKLVESTRIQAWLDVDPVKAKKTIQIKIKEFDANIKSLEGRLANKAYIEKAPEELVAETKAQLAENQQKLAQLQKVLQNL